MSLNRREFTASASLASLALAAGAAQAAEKDAGSSKKDGPLRVGFIGLGNRGDQVHDAFLQQSDVKITAVCDMYQPYLDFAASKVKEKQGHEPFATKDYKELLKRADVDAVAICTPDHWHGLMTAHALLADKDVYVEKPLGINIAEGRKLVDLAKARNKIVQVGIQRKSSALCREVVERIQAGDIGRVSVVRCFHVQNETPLGIGSPADSEPPPGFDWDAWQGPAKEHPYNKNRGFYRFRWFYDYSGGQLTNFGVHYLCLIHWALGVSAPHSVVAMGGKYVNFDNREVPDTLEVVWTYPTKQGDTLVTFSQFNATGQGGAARPCEIEFRGTKGTLYFTTSGYEIVPDNITPNEFPARSPIDRELERGYRKGSKPEIEPLKIAGKVLDGDHARNFVDAVKSRTEPSCPLEFGHRVTTAAQMANIALRTKQYLLWDAKKEQFTNNDAANAYLAAEYRKGYEWPKG